MAREWVRRKIGSLGRVVTGKTPPTADASNFNGPYPFITIPDLNGRVFIDRTGRTLSEHGARLLRSSILPAGAVMMSCIATVGRCGITTSPSFTNQQINSVIPTEEIDSRFLYYVFTQLGHELESAGGGGSVYTNVSKKRFSDIEVVIPEDIGEQRAIAHILGTLDDKIELNRRMSETLEQMARAIFKAWFVDFEPVRAKMEGRWQRGSPLPLGEGQGEGSSTSPVRQVPPRLLAFARALRRNAPDAENLLWRLLRNRALAGLKFRRQHPIPPYIVDFYCHELQLVIEIDGGHHDSPRVRRHDEKRTAFLEGKGLRLLRFWDNEVLRETEAVLQAIYEAIEERRRELAPSPPTPLPEGEGGILPAHLYDLFPDRLVHSELGEIPEGWRVGTLRDVAEVTSGKRPLEVYPKLTDRAAVPLWGGNGPMGYVHEPLFSNPILLTGRVGTLGAVFRIPDPCWPSDNTLVVLPQDESFFEYLYFSMKAFDLQALNRGSTQPLLTQTDLKNQEVLIPPRETLLEFHKHQLAYWARLDEGTKESRTLAALRDALLPKLVRGEIRVKDAERFLRDRGL
ncbi:MAG: restriction endonuclease subunit S [candidate division KSB1 bacterium]|nr:restriction endonuclease subunit S [candidate division KSB1 bacterium]